MGPHVLEGVELVVVVLHRVDVVVRTPAEREGGEGNHEDHCDTDEHTDEHRFLFNPIR